MDNLREVGGFWYILEVGSIVFAEDLDVKREGKRGLDAVRRMVVLCTEMRED